MPSIRISARAAVIAALAAVTVAIIGALVAIGIANPGGSSKNAARPPVTGITAPPTTRATTTTTVPRPTAQFVADPTTGNGTVTVSAPFTLTLATTNAACWVSVDTDNGQTLFTGTLQPGAQQQVPATGPLTVRLGNTAAIQISVNGTPLQLPESVRRPTSGSQLRRESARQNRAVFYGPEQAAIHHERFGALALNAARLVLNELERRGRAPRTVVDLGSGSGIFARVVSDAGYDVRGVDISADMVALAARDAPQASFAVGSLHDAELPEAVAVVALGEALNYATDTRAGLDTLTALAARVRAALEPGGLFVFDVATPGRGERTERFTDTDEWSMGLTITETPGSLVREIVTFVPRRRHIPAHRRAPRAAPVRTKRGARRADESRLHCRSARRLRGASDVSWLEGVRRTLTPHASVGCVIERFGKPRTQLVVDIGDGAQLDLVHDFDRSERDRAGDTRIVDGGREIQIARQPLRLRSELGQLAIGLQEDADLHCVDMYAPERRQMCHDRVVNRALFGRAAGEGRVDGVAGKTRVRLAGTSELAVATRTPPASHQPSATRCARKLVRIRAVAPHTVSSSRS